MTDCGHTRPTFGCDSCIEKERKATVEEARRTLPPPNCPECDRRMMADEADHKTMTVSYICPAEWCDGEVSVKVR